MTEFHYTKNYYRGRRRRLLKWDEIFADKILELANLVGGALIFGQFINQDIFSFSEFLLGFATVIAAYIYVWYYLSIFN
jgi:hypothetical protein